MKQEPSPHRRMTRAEAKARTRQNLLEAAEAVFARKGFAGASVEEIAETAGHTIGALYSHFHSKEQLFLELLSARASNRFVSVVEILSAGEGGSADPFEAFSQLLVEVADKDTGFLPLQAEFWLYAVRNPDAMGALEVQRREQAEALRSLVAAAMERADVAPGIPVTTVTAVVLALFQGLVRQRRIEPASVPGDLFAQALRWLFIGMQASTAGRPFEAGSRS